MRTEPLPPPPAPPAPWRMPVRPQDYPDRAPELRHEEREALGVLLTTTRWHGGERRFIEARRVVERLDRPMLDVIALRQRDRKAPDRVGLALMRRAMWRRGTTLWAWAEADWHVVVGPSAAAYYAGESRLEGRVILLDAAYLLGGLADLSAVGHMGEIMDSARAYFGADLFARQVGRLAAVLVGQAGCGFGDGPAATFRLRQALARLFVLNRSPYLEDLTAAFLEAHVPPRRSRDHFAFRRVVTGLECLGIVDRADAPRVARLDDAYDVAGVAPHWAAWCLAWGRRNTRLAPAGRRQVVNGALAAGRWLRDTHPHVTSPEQWDEDLALDYVRAVCDMTAGQYGTADGQRTLRAQGGWGRSLGPAGIHSKLGHMRNFFSGLQDYPHAVDGQSARRIAVRFKPAQAFATPPPIKRLLQPDPRDIDQVLWYKLVYAAATLAEGDLPPGARHPVTFYRALALVWVSTGRRSDEIRRLRLDCVRRDWAPDMLSDDGPPVERDQGDAVAPLCYLRVPSGKYRGPYWIWIPGYVADAIDAWIAERPASQPPLWDDKDRAFADYLFCYKGRRMDKRFINLCLIPPLFRKATGGANGVPRDARGVITSHRARSTRATVLRLLGVPLDDIAEYLGHTDGRTVRHYARTHPLQLARIIRKASDEERIIEGVIDMQAAQTGRPSVRWWLGWDADGEPRYCGHPAWHTCAHRLECVKCSAFIGGEAARLLKEGQDTIPIQGAVPMTPVEKAAADGDVEVFEELLVQLKDVPPPPLTGPADIFNPSALSQADDAAQSERELATVRRSIAEAEAHPQGRGVLIKALRAKAVALEGALVARRMGMTAGGRET